MIDMSPRALARTAGALYLLNIVAGAFAIGFVTSALVVAGDAAATAHNVQTNELLYRFGLAAHVIVTMTNVPLAVIFYELFKVVDRRVAALVLFFSVVGTAVEAAGLLNQFATLAVLDGRYSSAFTAAQMQALAYVPFDLRPISYDISAVFFGGFCLAVGYLIFRSTFFPRAIGVLMAIDGLAYLTNSFTTFLAPGFAAHLFPYIQLPTLAGEGSLTVWLLAVGVNAGRWTAWEKAA